MPGVTLQFTCRIEPLPLGSRMAQSVEVTGPLGAIMGGPMAKQIAATFDPILAALSEHAEKQ
jgi:hypothetical protein